SSYHCYGGAGCESAEPQLLSLSRVALLGLPENSAFIIVLAERQPVPGHSALIIVSCNARLLRKFSFYHCFAQADASSQKTQLFSLFCGAWRRVRKTQLLSLFWRSPAPHLGKLCFCHCFAQLERDSKKSTFINVLDRASTASFGAASLRF